MRYIFLIYLLIPLSLVSQNISVKDTITELNEINLSYSAKKLNPITYLNLKKDYIETQNIGQEPSFLLANTPSITFYSESGHSQGYSFFRIRGIDQSRVNISFDGVPLNDPLDHNFYFANFTDLLNSVSQIQIQRGVGSSKNGSASYAGSIEFFSPNLRENKYSNFGIGYGSFNSLRSFGEYNSGVNNNKAIYARISKNYSGGFKKHSSNNAQSLFISSGIYLDKTIWKLNILAGHHNNNSCWQGVTMNLIEQDVTTNGNSEFEKDKFSQILIQLQNHHYINKNSYLKSSLYYNYGNGMYNWDYDNYLGLTSQGENLYDYDINTNLFGFFSSYILSNTKFYLSSGIHVNSFKNNFQETSPYLISRIDNRYKREISTFMKSEYYLNKFTLHQDIQFRQTQFDYCDNIHNFQTITWNFINPKIGLSYQYNPNHILYYSIGRTSREPARSDMFSSLDFIDDLALNENWEYILPDNYDGTGNSLISNTTHEETTNQEIGIRHNSKKLNFMFNFYHLNFKNEIILVGGITPGGNPITSNVANSQRYGIELSTSYKLFPNLEIRNNSSFNYSKIKDNNESFQHILSPKMIINQEIIYCFNNFSLSYSLRYQDKSFINLANSILLDDYWLFNSRMSYKINNLNIALFINNIFNIEYFNYAKEEYDIVRYNVQSGRSIFLSLNYKIK